MRPAPALPMPGSTQQFYPQWSAQIAQVREDHFELQKGGKCLCCKKRLGHFVLPKSLLWYMIRLWNCFLKIYFKNFVFVTVKQNFVTGKGICQGDSGGPLIIPAATGYSYELIGVTSFTANAARGGCQNDSYPGIVASGVNSFTTITDRGLLLHRHHHSRRLPKWQLSKYRSIGVYPFITIPILGCC